ncbi:hypothetical protein [Streptococcus ovis]|uniref:hypothetical protein n=1 Tax=Streptococcus ovis TaxID=82806 RepID=UPI00036E9FD3|nr:hypothetical protein [Streptococcus ovis]
MKYIIFSFEEGDYLCTENGQILIFETLGLAYQYLQENFHQPIPETRTKKIIHYPAYYRAPFRLCRAV